LYWKLSSAYETINDPAKRRTYDTIWPRIKENRRAEEEAQKRETEAAEKERKRTAEEKMKNQKEESARQERLQHYNYSSLDTRAISLRVTVSSEGLQ
jgi:hypothetical protein